eukprot:scaffold18501_cov69-Phaeocystis_antarctica.AAC.4
MSADLSNELLEKTVLHSGRVQREQKKWEQEPAYPDRFKPDKTRVMDYINRLNNYYEYDMSDIAVGSELYEEALTFKKT